MADYRNFKCFGTYDGSGVCRNCIGLAECRTKAARTKSVQAAHKSVNELNVMILDKALSDIRDLVRSGGADYALRVMRNNAVFHEGRQYDLVEVLGGFFNGDKKFVGSVVTPKPMAQVAMKVAWDEDDKWDDKPTPQTAPMKKLDRTLSEIEADEDVQRQFYLDENKKHKVVEEAMKKMSRRSNRKLEDPDMTLDTKDLLDQAFGCGPQAAVQSEAICLDNSGIEEYFDKDISYLVETHIKPEILWVIDRFGNRRECFRSRFTKVSI